MKFGPIALDQAVGKTLGHNVSRPDGRPLLRKGRPLTAEDVATLRGIGRQVVYVAEPGPEDVDENAAARRVADAVRGGGLRLTGTAGGRVNLLAEALGVLRVDVARLTLLNGCEGITMATLAARDVVRAGQVVATVKVIPFFVPEATVLEAERIAADGGPLMSVDVLAARTVGLILSGAPAVRERVERDYGPPLRERIEALGSRLGFVDFVSLEGAEGEEALAGALRRQVEAGAELIVLAGETAIVDPHDIAPRAVERAGGQIACFGAPVDPGNLLLLAYLGGVPLLGAPGCARSRKVNMIDWVLPRLLAGERLGRADVVELGHGGLLEDVRERPMPRDDLV